MSHLHLRRLVPSRRLAVIMARAAYYSDRLSLPHEPPGPPGPQGTPYSEHTVGNRELHHDIAGTDTENQTDHGHLRQCSVRGCTTVLPPDYLQKMCESCRGRHRIYASTKRAKRKMEKLAIGGQLGPVVWMPPHSDGRDDHPQAGPSTQPTPPVEVMAYVRSLLACTDPFSASGLNGLALSTDSIFMGEQCDRS